MRVDFLKTTILFFVLSIILTQGLAQAALSSVSGHADVGKRSTADDYEEEGADYDYTYHNYHFKLEEAVSDSLAFNLSAFAYDKDYKSNDALDNRASIFKTNWKYYIKKLKEELLALNCKLEYWRKNYSNSPKDEYRRTKFSSIIKFEEKDDYSLDAGIGADISDYINAENKDEFKVFSQAGAGRYFLENKLWFKGEYKIETAQKRRINREKTKQEISTEAGYLFDLKYLYKISAGFGRGSRDSKDDEAIDEDFDYSYSKYFLESEHRINPKLKTRIKYTYFKKDYLGADLDHHGFYLDNDLGYELFEDEKIKCQLNLGAGQKELWYPQRQDNSFQKQNAYLKAEYQRKKDWKAASGLDIVFYDYGEEMDDKTRTYLLLSLEKLFLQGDLSLSLDCKYRITDYQYKNDEQSQGIRTEFKYKF